MGQTRLGEGEPAGKATLPMGSLDHQGYTMSNANDFYKRFILEVVPNNAFSNAFDWGNLRPIKPTNGEDQNARIGNRVHSRVFYNHVNAPDRMNVMYSQAAHGRGQASHREEVYVERTSDAFWEARSMSNESQVRPRIISFPFPGNPEKYVWIDLSWPIRSILLPISQQSFPGEKPCCTYVELNFRRMGGRMPTSGWREDGNQSFTDWNGHPDRGLVWEHQAATMRIDLDLLYKLLLIPRGELRKSDYNVLSAFQVMRWDHGIQHPPIFKPYMAGFQDSYSDAVARWYKYPDPNVPCASRNSRVGLALNDFLSRINGVSLDYSPPQENQVASILSAIISSGFSFIPVIGPLMAFGSSMAINAITDPTGSAGTVNAAFGINLGTAFLQSALGFREHVKLPRGKSGFEARSSESSDEVKSLIPEVPEIPMALLCSGDESAADYEMNPKVMEQTPEEIEMAKKEPSLPVLQDSEEMIAVAQDFAKVYNDQMNDAPPSL